jgi:hypothetical protein
MEAITAFLNALNEGRLKEFFLGEGGFYTTVPDFPDEYSINAGWRKFLLPYVQSDHYSQSFIPLFKKHLLELLDEQDVNKGIYYFIRHLYSYYYYKQEGKITFELPFTDGEKEMIKAALSKNRQQLKQDKRWAGADWHSQDGLWEPLQNDLTIIKDRFGGIDLL